MEVLMSKQLTDTDIELHLAIPTDCLWTSQFPERGFSMIFQATDSHQRIWNFQVTTPDFIMNNQNPFLHGEWLRFVKERGLMVGDIITLSREEDTKNGKQHYITIGNKILVEGDDEIRTTGDSAALLSAETNYLSHNSDVNRKVKEQMFAIANFIVEAIQQ
ncbi:hypothetical protein JCGZ_09189 [Jatropha curcas]|uniref:TF-B3 domain-containing protein n=1 Tax=Jatropha curcas TaxID=180498 RepID=A0A067KF97_JATCU|nr:uncharacterized protein LOC105636822 isoform X2 [Jatropha curcas]KDP34901.1 hypothetical protein JCGZ_09189 [Jatropha curcas]